jgi:uncharacterized membrane protein
MKSKYYKWILIIFLGLFVSGTAFGQEIVQTETQLLRGQVIEVLRNTVEIIPGTDTEIPIQELSIRLTEEPFENQIITLTNDYQPVEVGTRVWVRSLSDQNGEAIFAIHDIARTRPLMILLGLFIALVLVFGRMQGFRSLISLAASFSVLFLILVPLLVRGYPPIMTSIIVAVAILFFAIFLTHGFKKQSAIAFSGTVLAITCTGIFAWIATRMTYLSGFAEHEAVYLNFNTGGTLDFTSLFLAGVLIGTLGVLDDIAITQVAVVRELYALAKKDTPLIRIYEGAIRVGKEHVSALVNTLVLAYAGVALPAILFFSTTGEPFAMIVNQEVFAAEIVRTIVGSFGLILTVPITTGLAVWFLRHTRGIEVSGAEGHGHHHH